MQDHHSLYLNLINTEVGWRVDFLRIVDDGDEIFFDLSDIIRIYPRDLPGVIDAKQKDTAITIEKCTDGFINIPIKGASAFLEFQREAFALSDKFCYLAFIRVHFTIHSYDFAQGRPSPFEYFPSH